MWFFFLIRRWSNYPFAWSLNWASTSWDARGKFPGVIHISRFSIGDLYVSYDWKEWKGLKFHDTFRIFTFLPPFFFHPYRYAILSMVDGVQWENERRVLGSENKINKKCESLLYFCIIFFNFWWLWSFSDQIGKEVREGNHARGKCFLPFMFPPSFHSHACL